VSGTRPDEVERAVREVVPIVVRHHDFRQFPMRARRDRVSRDHVTALTAVASGVPSAAALLHFEQPESLRGGRHVAGDETLRRRGGASTRSVRANRGFTAVPEAILWATRRVAFADATRGYRISAFSN
jgi:hypothetical protein